MWCCVDLVCTDVLEELIASIFRVEKSKSEEPASAGGCRLSSSWFLARGFYYPEDGGDKFLQNVSTH
jgi:hypothetical protein